MSNIKEPKTIILPKWLFTLVALPLLLVEFISQNKLVRHTGGNSNG